MKYLKNKQRAASLKVRQTKKPEQKFNQHNRAASAQARRENWVTNGNYSGNANLLQTPSKSKPSQVTKTLGGKNWTATVSSSSKKKGKANGKK
jgi:hypothetical protein